MFGSVGWITYEDLTVENLVIGSDSRYVTIIIPDDLLETSTKHHSVSVNCGVS
jgi:hypothetical protein